MISQMERFEEYCFILKDFTLLKKFSAISFKGILGAAMS